MYLSIVTMQAWWNGRVWHEPGNLPDPHCIRRGINSRLHADPLKYHAAEQALQSLKTGTPKSLYPLQHLQSGL